MGEDFSEKLPLQTEKKISTVPARRVKAEELHSGQKFVESLAGLLVGHYPTPRWHLEGSSQKKIHFIKIWDLCKWQGTQKPTKNKQVNILRGIHSYPMFQL